MVAPAGWRAARALVAPEAPPSLAMGKLATLLMRDNRENKIKYIRSKI
jgi:hypothetical protein